MSCNKEGKVILSKQEDIEGINGKIAWILISYAQTEILHGYTCLNKAFRIKHLELFVQEYSRGELYCNLKVLNLFYRYKYRVFPTRADASYQNVPVECAHQTVTATIPDLLSGAGLHVKF